MLNTRSDIFLRYTLLADAVASGATGLLMVAGAGLLEGLLGLPSALTREAGLLLVPYVAFVAFVGTREDISRTAVQTTIVVNVIWAVCSFGLLVTDYVAPTMLGYAFVIGQAAVVALFAELQFIGLRQSSAVAA
jgi:hypothetical protein